MVKSPPVNAGDMGVTPGLGRPDRGWDNQARHGNSGAHTLETTLHEEEKPHAPQPDKAHALETSLHEGGQPHAPQPDKAHSAMKAQQSQTSTDKGCFLSFIFLAPNPFSTSRNVILRKNVVNVNRLNDKSILYLILKNNLHIVWLCSESYAYA